MPSLLRIRPWSALLLVLMIGTFGASLGWAGPLDRYDTDSTQSIIGGDAAEICQWPTTVVVQSGGTCTATLIHPRIIVYAAHCGESFQTVKFGESDGAPARQIDIDHCRRFINTGQTGTDDYAYCKLAEPVEDLPPTPVIFGCEVDQLDLDDPVAIVGYGLDDEFQVGNKRWAMAQINSNNSLIVIGGGGIGADEGDSGGPAFFQLDDGSWRAIGIVTSGNGGGDAARYVQMYDIVPWVEEHSNVDVTPCHLSDGTWAPTPRCEGFATDPTVGGEWESGCGEGDLLSDASAQCGAPWTDVDDVDAPTVAIGDPEDGDSFDAVPTTLDIAIDAADPGVLGVDSLGLRRVSLMLDGEPVLDEHGQLSTDEVPPFVLAGVEFDEGFHEMWAVAEDWAGHVTDSEPVAITVGEPEPEDTDDTNDTSGSDETDETDPTDEESDTGEPTEPRADGDGDGGCGCGASESPGRAAGAWLALLMLAVGRRRAGLQRSPIPDR